MWDIPRYTSGDRAFSFFWGASETTRAGTGAGARIGAGAQASKTALKIRYKSSLEYLGILVAVGGELARGFPPEGPAGWSNNLSPDLEGGEESRGATEEATEEAMERRSWQGHPRPWTEIILGLELIFF